MKITGTYTDQYQLAMSQVYHLKGMGKQTAVFDYFFRKLPFNGAYAIFAGLDVLLDILEDLIFDETDLDYLSSKGFDSSFIKELKKFKFKGNVYSFQEGDVVFPNCPIVIVEANLIEAQIIETVLLNILNYQTLIATKASRLRKIAGDKTLIDFGMRRAHGLAAYYASRASIIGGFDSTSNVKAAKDFDILASGTMAHSFIQSFDDELSAFRNFAEIRPINCILLVDTYNTLTSGIPNAIIVAKEMEAKGYKLLGIRLDSGDLTELSKKARIILDKAGLNYVKIAVSNQLNEDSIEQLVRKNAPIDILGIGTDLVTGQDDSALDGVYKLAFLNGKPRIKLSESNSKITLPHLKQIHRFYSSNGQFEGADIIALKEDNDFSLLYDINENTASNLFANYKTEPLLKKVMENGYRVSKAKSVQEIAKYSQKRLSFMPEKYKSLIEESEYKVGISHKLYKERKKLIEKFM